VVTIHYQTKKHQEQAATHQLPVKTNYHYLQTQLIFSNVSYIM